MADENVGAESAGTEGQAASSRYPAPSLLEAALLRQNTEWSFEMKETFGELTITIPRDHILAVCSFLKTDPEFTFDLLADLSGVDRGPEEEPRFEVNYHLFSTNRFHRLRLKVLLAEGDEHVTTVTAVWRTANWHERETFDLVGIIFDGHPDLRRILMPDDSLGHPLRKDYPLRGYEPYSLT